MDSRSIVACLIATQFTDKPRSFSSPCSLLMVGCPTASLADDSLLAIGHLKMLLIDLPYSDVSLGT